MASELFDDYPLGALVGLGQDGAPPPAGSDRDGRTSVNQGPGGGADYPFARAHVLGALLTDFDLSYRDDPGRFATPLRVVWLHGFGALAAAAPPGVPDPVHDREVLVADAAGEVVFDSTLATSWAEVPWGTARRIVEWRDPLQVVRLVFRLAAVADLADELAYADAVLDPRTYRRLPRGVRAIRVGLTTFAGTVRLRAGYNAVLAAATPDPADGGRAGGVLTVSGVPGAGLGRASGCADFVPVVRRINRVGAGPGGNFGVEADQCLRLQLPVTVGGDLGPGRAAAYGTAALAAAEAAHGLALDAGCKPCCSCDDYVATYAGVRRVWDDAAGVAARAEAARDAYAANRDRWLAQAECRREHALTVVGLTEAACRNFVAAVLCNQLDCCLQDVELRFTFVLYRDGVLQAAPLDLAVLIAYIDGGDTRGEEAYAPEVVPVPDGPPLFRFRFTDCPSQRRVMAKMRLRYPCAVGDTLVVHVTAHARSVPCPAPDATVPAEAYHNWLEADAVDPTRALTATAVLAAASKAMPVDPTPLRFLCAES